MFQHEINLSFRSWHATQEEVFQPCSWHLYNLSNEQSFHHVPAPCWTHPLAPLGSLSLGMSPCRGISRASASWHPGVCTGCAVATGAHEQASVHTLLRLCLKSLSPHFHVTRATLHLYLCQLFLVEKLTHKSLPKVVYSWEKTLKNKWIWAWGEYSK